MKKVICCPANQIPQEVNEGAKYFSMYSNSKRPEVGSFGSTLIKDLRREGIEPTEEIWDFNTIALSVVAADRCLSRQTSPDGWTREIDLTVHLCNPQRWIPLRKDLELLLKFLTGDIWSLTLKGEGISFPSLPKTELDLFHVDEGENDEDCVCLLSGGIDSLVGALDLVADNHRPLFVSQWKGAVVVDL